MSAPGQVHFGREVCDRLDVAEEKEWLVTNGIGGFASGTVAGSATRRYHGLLIAALHPPVGRVQLVAALDETARYNGNDYALATHRWASGIVDPQGYHLIESFSLDGTAPVWRYALADSVLEKRIFMRHSENTTYIQYALLRGGPSLELDLKALVNYRDFHSSTHAGDWRMNIEAIEYGAKVTAFDGATPFYLRSANATAELHHEWYRSCFLSQERTRGLDDNEDHLFAANFHAILKSGSSISIVVSTEESASLEAETIRQELAHEQNILRLGNVDISSNQKVLPNRDQLLLAADQFIVKRALPEEPEGRSIIAGYHWFGDWGRDTMIALPGLTLSTGRPEVARQILLAFSRYVDQGMLPNNFPDAGGSPEYNTIDASLWFFEAVRQYHEVTGDIATINKLFPILVEMADVHIRGTRYNIHVDPSDGLLYGGGPGAQLTWMDAKIGDWIVTPRTGKPVEINALWINALHTLSAMARTLKMPADAYEQLGSKAAKNFQRFWNEERSCCFDVIDAPGIGNDSALRPNQIFAISLPISPLTPQQQKSVVDICARELLTPFGLCTLASSEAGYVAHYGGTAQARDAGYHQGTVWAWLLGPFAIAHFRVYKDAAAAQQFLEPLAAQIFSHGIGSISEIFDAEPPFAPNGCIAQAWSVAELLRAWQFLTKT